MLHKTDYNIMLYEHMRKYLALGDIETLLNSDALIWVEQSEEPEVEGEDALPFYQELLEDITSVLPEDIHVDYEILDDSYPTVVIPLQYDGREEVVNINEEEPNETYGDEYLGYLPMMVETLQQLLAPDVEFRWFKAYEEEDDQAVAWSRPLLVLTSDQWRRLEQDFGAIVKQRFSPVRVFHPGMRF